jgi:hypothetical protein
MGRPALVALVLAALCGPGETQEVGALRAITKIFLGDFGNGEGADLVREKVRLRLARSERFSVVESADMADAVMTGSAGVDRSYHSVVSGSTTGGVSGTGSTVHRGYGVLTSRPKKRNSPCGSLSISGASAWAVGPVAWPINWSRSC